MRGDLETSAGTGLAAGTYSGYSLHAEAPEKGINLILSQPSISCSRVTRLSPTVVWALPEPGTELPPRERTLQVLLDDNGRTIGPLRGEILWSDPRRYDAPIGIQFVGVTLEQGRQILSVLDAAAREGRALPAVSPRPIEEALVEPERIRSILKSVCVMKHEGLLRQLGRTLRVSLEYFDVASSRLHWRLEEPGAHWGAAPYDIEVVGHNTAYRLRVPALETRGNRMVTPLPRRLWKVRHRSHRRVPAPAGLRARFHHPLWGELGTLEHEVVDLSFNGLGLRGTPEDLVFPGLLLQPIEVWGESGEPLLLRGEVRHVGDKLQDGQRVFGLQVVPHTPLDEARWVQLVSQALCPSTRGGEELLEPLWELFVDSGYFHLAGKTTEHFEELRASFLDTSRRAAHLPRLFCQTVWPSERGVEATLSSVRAYRHTWLVHQLAKRPGKPALEVPPGQILRDLHVRTLEHVQSDPNFRWLVAYTESTVPLIARVHHAYAQEHAASGEALVMPVRLMHVNCDERSGLPASGFELGPARFEEKTRLVEEIARTRPACYVDALDLSRERLDLRDTAERWRAVGLERERQVLVARREGVAVAAIILELGPPGTNLFRLLDAARLFPLAIEGPDAYVALLDEAREWYARRGRTAFVLLREDEDDGYTTTARLHDEPGTKPCLWLLSARMLPDFLEYVSEATVGRLTLANRTA
ncbi:PilZ domain-containing protein [Archangium sp.]|uniref:PilZ domain-containing protein n=1 Tax=Archangium sp. TaxID=1872627 RepID=UPI002D6EDAA9|nr:PilZ domain-containing protein [Archangium sp.]HYO55334.1 PilZ domain-containing protein [Archangium sp.]